MDFNDREWQKGLLETCAVGNLQIVFSPYVCMAWSDLRSYKQTKVLLPSLAWVWLCSPPGAVPCLQVGPVDSPGGASPSSTETKEGRCS